MIMVCESDNSFRMIPMSNTYEDCKVCAGTVKLNANKFRSVAEAFNHAMNAFWAREWNDHETMARLFSSHNRYIFRWDIGLKQLPMIDPLLHMKVSSPSISGVSALSDVIRCSDKPAYDGTLKGACENET